MLIFMLQVGIIFRPLARRLAFHVGLYHGLGFKPLSLCADYGLINFSYSRGDALVYISKRYNVGG